MTSGPKPDLTRSLGARYVSALVGELDEEFDVGMECTGVPPVVADALGRTGRNGIVCLTGVPGPARRVALDLGALNREWVLDNDVVFGSLNANRRHYQAAAEALAAADRSWLQGLVTRGVPVRTSPRASTPVPTTSRRC